jgi:membrane associated rhomboid family serine protease
MTRTRRSRATWLLTAAVLAASAATALAIGDIADIGVLIRAGALVRGIVSGGEPWRLVACIFLHVGGLHLVLNATALVVLGRLVEELFGSVRMIAIFGVAGVAGALASYLASPAGISAGASGAVFGLLGAVFLEITWHRQRYRTAWKRGMWGGLAVVTVGQLAYGFFYPVVDQWAHAAGLVGGALVGVVLSPNARWATAGRHLARVLALAFAAAAVLAALLVVRTPLADSLAGTAGTRRQIVGDAAITVPAGWEASPGQVYQPDGVVVVKLAHQPRTVVAEQLAMWLAEEGRRSRDEIGELAAAREPLIALPAGWEGAELEAAPEDAMGYHQRVRVIVCARPFGDVVIFTAIQVPETIARAAPEFFVRLLASIGPA